MRKHYAIGFAAALIAVGLTGSQPTSGAGESEPSAFVSITPCRLFDTRPELKVGPYATLTPSSTRDVTVHGSNGNCNIPATATAVSMNVTVVGGTAPSFLTVWPSDAAKRPVTSNLNWVAGAPPTPNKVDVALSTSGKVSFFNRFGNVDVLADVVGYYETVEADAGTISDIEVVTQAITIKLNSDGTGANGQATAKCPSGTVAIAGGVENPEEFELNVRSSRPDPVESNNPTGWFGDVRTPDEAAAGSVAMVYATCITLNL